MPTGLCCRKKCRRPSIWPAGTRHDSPAPAGARMGDWRCWSCGGRLRRRRENDPPAKVIPRAAVARQLVFPFAAPPAKPAKVVQSEQAEAEATEHGMYWTPIAHEEVTL